MHACTPVTIASLIAQVEGFYELGYIDEQDVELGPINKLIAAKAKIEQGKMCTTKNIMMAFIRHVRAQSGEHKKVELVSILTADAKYLIDHLDN